MLNLGNIIFGLGADTSGLTAALRNVQNFGNRVTEVVKSQQGALDAGARQLVRQEGAMIRGLQNIQNKIAQVNRTAIAPDVKLENVRKLEQAYESLARKMNTRADRPLDTLAFQRGQLGFKDAIDSVMRSISAETAALRNAGDTGAAAFQKQQVAAMKAEYQVEQLVNAINKAQAAGSIKPGQAATMLGGAQGALGNFQQAMASSNPLDAVGMSKATIGLQRNLSQLKGELSDANKAANPLIATFRGIGSAIELSAGPLNGFVFRIRAATDLMSRHGVAVGAVVGALTGLATVVGFLGLSVIKTNMELERTEVMLKAVSGSAVQTAVDMAFVRRVSDQAGLAFAQTAKDYARYSASAIAAGESTEQVQKQFQQIAMAAGTLQLSVDDTRGVFRALEQIMSKGTVQSEELRGQLADRFPAAFSIAAQAIGKTTKELGEMMKKGDVISRDFVPKFLDAMTKFYNVDLSKPIDTLAAGINRLSNSWTFFLQAINNALNATGVAKQIVNALSEGLNFLSKNMTQVIGVVGALAGAIAALFALMVAQSVWTIAAAGVTSFASALALARTASELLTAAQIGLNIAMMSNPIGALLGLVVKLAAVIGGAVLGYNLLTNAVNRNASSMADMSGIETYIAGQQRLGFQIAATTQELIKQQRALLMSERASLDDAAAKTRSAASRAQGYFKFIGPEAAGKGGGKIGEFLIKQTTDAAKSNIELAEVVQRRAKVINDLINLSKLPAQASSAIEGVTTGDGGKKKKHKLTDSEKDLNKVLELLERGTIAAQGFEDQLQFMWNGGDTRDLFLLEAASKAQTAIKDLDEKALSQLKKSLEELGFVGATTTEALVKFYQSIDKSQEEVRDAIQVFDSLRDAMLDLEDQRDALQAGRSGSTLEGLLDLEYMAKASRQLDRLSQSSLAAVSDQLTKAGIAGSTTVEQWANMLKQLDRNQEALDQTKQVLADNISAWQSWSDGVIDNIASVLDGTQSLGDGIKNIMKDLAGTILKTALYDPIKLQLSNGIRDVLGGRKNGGDSTLDANALTSAAQVGTGFMDTVKGIFTKGTAAGDGANALEDLTAGADAASQVLGGNILQAGAGLVGQFFGLGSAITTNALGMGGATTALMMFTQAVNAASMSLSLGGGGAGSGGFFSKILKVGTSLLGAGVTPGLTPGMFNGNVDFLSGIPNPVFPRAAGGPMTRGNAYLINEPGTSGDLFIPGQSGYAVPNSQLTSSERSVTIDASIKYIDARGATPDAVAALERMVMDREARLRAELPYIIDGRTYDSQRRGRF